MDMPSVEEILKCISDQLADIRSLLKNLVNLTVAVSLSENASVPWDVFEEITSEQDVTINPGEEKTVLFVDDFTGLLLEMGVNDETYSLYKYLIDSQPLSSPQPQPIGLYNSPYRFPNPILVNNSIEIKVERTSDAAAAAEYYAKVRVLRLPPEIMDSLRSVWS